MSSSEQTQGKELVTDSDFQRGQLDTLADLQEQRIKLLEEKVALYEKLLEEKVSLYEVLVAKYKERGDIYRDLLVRLHPEFGDKL